MAFFSTGKKRGRPSKSDIEKKDYVEHIGNPSKNLTVHIMQNGNKEVTKPKKTKIYAQEFTWKNRMWPIAQQRIITDAKGLAHIYLDVNDSAALSFNKDHADKCVKCGGKMTIDARNARDLLKKRTISSLWGSDQSHIMLLLIMGVALMVMVAITFFIYTENVKTNTKLQAYLTPAPAPIPNPTTNPQETARQEALNSR